MKVAFDTSVLVAGSVAGHEHGPRATAWLDGAKAGRFEAQASWHAFGEVWATLTALPATPRVPPALAERVVQRLGRHVRPGDLTWPDYLAAMERCVDRGLRSGAFFDALHLIVAERWAADLFLTFNTRHFSALAGPDTPRIAAPPDPPGFGDLRDCE